MNFDNNIRQKQDFSDMNIGKILFCVICVLRLSSKPLGFSGLIKRLQSKSCPKGAAHLLRECGFFARLVRQKSLKVLKLPMGFYSAQNSLPDCFARFAGRLLTFYSHKLTRITQRKLLSL
jgi:hypothetical protein